MPSIEFKVVNVSTFENIEDEVISVGSHVDAELKSDMEQFDAFLHSDPQSQSVFKSVDFISNQLSEKKIDFEIQLNKAVKTAEAKDILAATRSLSDYSLHTAMIAKVAGKTSQAIDKLTNLH